MGKYPSSPSKPPSTLLWVRGLCCGVAGVRAESPGRLPIFPSKVSRPAPTPASISARVSDDSGLSGVLCKRCCHPAEPHVFGSWEETVRDNNSHTAVVPYAAMQLRALWFPEACHQQQGLGHPVFAIPARHSCRDALVVPASSTWAMGCGLPGVRHPSAWMSGRYPCSHARAGCTGSMMPITMKGALYPSGMRDDSKFCVQGVQALVGHIHICIPPLQPPPLSCTLLLSLHPVPSLTFSHMPWEWLQPPTLPSDV